MLLSDLNDTRGSGGNLGPELSTFLGDGASDSGTLHLTLEVDDDSGVVLKVDEDTLSPSPGLSLPDDDSLQDLLSELRLTLLDGNDDHITRGSTGQAVEPSTDTLNGDNVQVLTTTVISAVDQRGNTKTEGHSHLCTGSTASSLHVLDR